MNVRLERRVAFEVRRDAAQELTNGRVLYDALFSRTGFQTYGESVEYRPASEVFDADSLASLANLPGVLLHPSSNYGVSFGEGAYPVRGVTGSEVVEHTDGVHTAGQLMVWDEEWNGLIAAGEIVELSLGYGITPGPATTIDGQAVDVVHTKIIGDHAAGVPEGNAGTARVVLDAASRLATRPALAGIASMRMDARPLHYDLGASLKSWPTRNDSTKDTPTMLIEKLHIQFTSRLDDLSESATARQIKDAWIDVYGESDDPAMKRVAAALAADEPAPAAAAPSAPAAPIVDAEDPESEEDPEAEADRRADAANQTLVYADAFELARTVHGRTFTARGDDGRKDSGTPWTLEQLRLSVVTKTDAKTGARIERLDAKDRSPAIGLAFEQARDVIDAAAKSGPKLALAINDARSSGVAESTANAEKIRAIQDKLQADELAATTKIFGARAPQPSAPA